MGDHNGVLKGPTTNPKNIRGTTIIWMKNLSVLMLHVLSFDNFRIRKIPKHIATANMGNTMLTGSSHDI
jgi:hypothetical protein